MFDELERRIDTTIAVIRDKHTIDIQPLIELVKAQEVKISGLELHPSGQGQFKTTLTEITTTVVGKNFRINIHFPGTVHATPSAIVFQVGSNSTEISGKDLNGNQCKELLTLLKEVALVNASKILNDKQKRLDDLIELAKKG